jgi:hypothetical protein
MPTRSQTKYNIKLYCNWCPRGQCKLSRPLGEANQPSAQNSNETHGFGLILLQCITQLCEDKSDVRTQFLFEAKRRSNLRVTMPGRSRRGVNPRLPSRSLASKWSRSARKATCRALVRRINFLSSGLLYLWEYRFLQCTVCCEHGQAIQDGISSTTSNSSWVPSHTKGSQRQSSLNTVPVLKTRWQCTHVTSTNSKRIEGSMGSMSLVLLPQRRLHSPGTRSSVDAGKSSQRPRALNTHGQAIGTNSLLVVSTSPNNTNRTVSQTGIIEKIVYDTAWPEPCLGPPVVQRSRSAGTGTGTAGARGVAPALPWDGIVTTSCSMHNTVTGKSRCSRARTYGRAGWCLSRWRCRQHDGWCVSSPVTKSRPCHHYVPYPVFSARLWPWRCHVVLWASEPLRQSRWVMSRVRTQESNAKSHQLDAREWHPRRVGHNAITNAACCMAAWPNVLGNAQGRRGPPPKNDQTRSKHRQY